MADGPKQLIAAIRPPRPISELTEAERRELVELIVRRIAANTPCQRQDPLAKWGHDSRGAT
jgi:hypothetical protein